MRADVHVSTGILELTGGADFSGIAEALGITPEMVAKASKVAAQKAGRWAEREGAKALAAESHLSVRSVRAAMRAKLRQSKKGKGVTVWFGLNEIDAKFQNPRQTDTGVTTDAAEYQSAFIVEKLRGHVFRRKGTDRKKIEKVSFTIQAEGDKAIQTVAAGAGEMYVTEFFSALDAMSGKGEGSTQRTLIGL